jgi:hypothetical protein
MVRPEKMKQFSRIDWRYHDTANPPGTGLAKGLADAHGDRENGLAGEEEAFDETGLH